MANRKIWRFGLTTLAMLGALVAQVGTAGAAKVAPTVVACGQVITQSTTLAADVGPCPGDGIIIRADNITMNLNNKRIVGSGDHTDDRVGVRMPQTTGVSVTRGEITGFATGVYVNGSGEVQKDGRNVLSKLHVHNNYGPDRGANFGDGVFIYNSPNNRLTGSTIANNGYFDGVLVAEDQFVSPGNRIDHNVVRDNAENGPDDDPCGLGNIGISLGEGFGGNSGTMVDHNVVERNANGISAGFVFSPGHADDYIIVENIVTNSSRSPTGEQTCPFALFSGIGYLGAGIVTGQYSAPERGIVRGNNVHHNSGAGIYDFGSPSRFIDNRSLNNALNSVGDFDNFDNADLIAFCQFGSVWKGNIYSTVTEYTGTCITEPPGKNHRIPSKSCVGSTCPPAPAPVAAGQASSRTGTDQPPSRPAGPPRAKPTS